MEHIHMHKIVFLHYFDTKMDLEMVPSLFYSST